MSATQTQPTEAPETQPAPEALQVNMTYEEWLEMATRLSALVYEIDDLKDIIETLKVPDPNETSADTEKRLADVKEAEGRLANLEAEYEVVVETYDNTDVPDADDDEEGEQFDFGDSAADW
jgi:hypothetical protein